MALDGSTTEGSPSSGTVWPQGQSPQLEQPPEGTPSPSPRLETPAPLRPVRHTVFPGSLLSSTSPSTDTLTPSHAPKLLQPSSSPPVRNVQGSSERGGLRTRCQDPGPQGPVGVVRGVRGVPVRVRTKRKTETSVVPGPVSLGKGDGVSTKVLG